MIKYITKNYYVTFRYNIIETIGSNLPDQVTWTDTDFAEFDTEAERDDYIAHNGLINELPLQVF
jgi:hypothetical protein